MPKQLSVYLLDVYYWMVFLMCKEILRSRVKYFTHIKKPQTL